MTMYTVIWLSVVIIAQVFSLSATQPPCVIPDGHTDGEFVGGYQEPKGGQTCKQDGYVETIVRRCELRYCCQEGCTCTDSIFESINECESGTSISLSCFVEHRDYTFKHTVCCDGFEEDADGICIEVATQRSSTTSSTTKSTAPSSTAVPTTPRPSTTLQTTPIASHTTQIPTALPHSDSATSLSTATHLSLTICLPLAMLALIAVVLLLVYLRCRRRRKSHDAAVVFHNHGYDNAVYAIPQMLSYAEQDASLPPPYDEDPYEALAAIGGKKSAYDDDADGTYASCDPRDEKKEMSTPDDAYAHYDVPPCRKLGDY